MVLAAQVVQTAVLLVSAPEVALTRAHRELERATWLPLSRAWAVQHRWLPGGPCSAHHGAVQALHVSSAVSTAARCRQCFPRHWHSPCHRRHCDRCSARRRSFGRETVGCPWHGAAHAATATATGRACLSRGPQARTLPLVALDVGRRPPRQDLATAAAIPRAQAAPCASVARTPRGCSHSADVDVGCWSALPSGDCCPATSRTLHWSSRLPVQHARRQHVPRPAPPGSTAASLPTLSVRLRWHPAAPGATRPATRTRSATPWLWLSPHPPHAEPEPAPRHDAPRQVRAAPPQRGRPAAPCEGRRATRSACLLGHHATHPPTCASQMLATCHDAVVSKRPWVSRTSCVVQRAD